MAHSNLIQSLLRGMDVVELLSRSEGGMRLSEVAEELGVSSPTAHNLLRTLAARELVKQEGKVYRVGPGLGVLAARAARQQRFGELAGVMVGLAEAYAGATVTLAVAAGSEVRVRLRVSADRPGVIQRPETTFSLYGSVSALVILAYADGEQVARMRGHYEYAEFGSHLWKSEGELAQFVGGIREHGYGILPLGDRALWRVGVPVFAGSGEFLGALGMSLPSQAGGVPKEVATVMMSALDSFST